MRCTFGAFFACLGLVTANNSSCGGDQPSKVVDCDHPDMGSCGNACCTVDVETRLSPKEAYEAFKAELVHGGGDYSYAYSSGAGPGGQNPSDNLTQCEPSHAP